MVFSSGTVYPEGPYPYKIEHDTPHFDLTQTQYGIALVLFTAAWYFARIIVQKQVAHWVKEHIREEKRNSFSESFWKFVSFSVLVGFDWYIGSEYWNKPLAFYDEFPACHQTPIYVFFYLLQVTNYFAALVQHVDGTEEHRKDWWPMLIHHFATIILIAGSFHVNLFRIGSIVLLFHDACDVILEFAKMTTYAQYKYDEVFWVALVISWVFLRIWMLTMKVMIPVWYDMNWLAEVGQTPESLLYYRRWLVGFLIIIWFLNLFWFSLMVKGIWKLYVKKETFKGDPREEKEAKEKEAKESKKKH